MGRTKNFWADFFVKERKRFYVIRTHVDVSLKKWKQQQEQHQIREKSVSEALKAIKTGCESQLESMNLSPEAVKIYLVNTHNPNDFDFPDLLQDMAESGLSELKREAFLLQVSTNSLKILKEKKKILEADVWTVSLTSAGVVAIPVPGVGCAYDIVVIVAEILIYFETLQVSKSCIKSLENLSNVKERSIEEPLSQFVCKKSFFLHTIRENSSGKVLCARSALRGAVEIVRSVGQVAILKLLPRIAIGEAVELTKYIIGIGSAIAESTSFVLTASQLKIVLEDAYKCAKFANKVMCD